MAEHREQVDKRMMQQINRRVMVPLVLEPGRPLHRAALYGHVR